MKIPANGLIGVEPVGGERREEATFCASDGLRGRILVLAERLERLVEQGALERCAYSEHPPRYDYLLTQKGREFVRSAPAAAPRCVRGAHPRRDPLRVLR